MRKTRIAGQLIFTTIAFVSGLVVGLLIAPRSGQNNRLWVKQQTDEVADWVQKYRVSEDNKHLRNLAEEIRHPIKETVPDLYKATDEFGLEEDELVNWRDDE